MEERLICQWEGICPIVADCPHGKSHDPMGDCTDGCEKKGGINGASCVQLVTSAIRNTHLIEIMQQLYRIAEITQDDDYPNQRRAIASAVSRICLLLGSSLLENIKEATDG